MTVTIDETELRAAEKIRHVPMAAERLEKELAMLWETVGQLEDRLRPIIVNPEGLQEEARGHPDTLVAPTGMPRSEHAGTLDRYADRVDATRARLLDITRALDL